jgi:hypothetical protein
MHRLILIRSNTKTIVDKRGGLIEIDEFWELPADTIEAFFFPRFLHNSGEKQSKLKKQMINSCAEWRSKSDEYSWTE